VDASPVKRPLGYLSLLLALLAAVAAVTVVLLGILTEQWAGPLVSLGVGLSVSRRIRSRRLLLGFSIGLAVLWPGQTGRPLSPPGPHVD
jgi:hypothetical protein